MDKKLDELKNADAPALRTDIPIDKQIADLQSILKGFKEISKIVEQVIEHKHNG